MSTTALFWAFKQKVGDPVAKLALICLADHATEDHSCFVSRKLLVTYCESSFTTVDRKLALLVKAGLITKEHRTAKEGDNTSNHYTLRGVASNWGHPPSDCGQGSPKMKPPWPQNEATMVNLPLDPPFLKPPASQTAVLIPDGLSSPEFLEVWNTYLKTRRTKLKPPSQLAKLKELATWGQRAAIEALNTSISNGWTGVFQPKSAPGKSAGIREHIKPKTVLTFEE